MNKISILLLIIAAVIVGGVFLYNSNNKKKIYDFTKTQKEDEPKPGAISEDELKEKIGQMIMAGFRGTEASVDSDIFNMIKDVEIGGVALFDYDLPSNSYPRNIVNYEQTKKLISDIQKYSKIPLFVAVDAEGGNVNRLKPKYGFLPVLSAEDMGKDKTFQTTKKESAQLSEQLKQLGFNMNFAPVVDLNINPKNPIIGALGRSFSADAGEASEHAKIFVENHLKNNIIAVAKHFPGQGSGTKDSHSAEVDVTNTYKEEELLPYKILNQEGLLKAVMPGHIINKKIDQNYPASLSEVFLQDILREQLEFTGIIISDDMQMGALSNSYTLEESIITAIDAGVDIITVLNNSRQEYDKNLARKASDIIFNAVRDGKISASRIEESYIRIINLKKEFGIIY